MDNLQVNEIELIFKELQVKDLSKVNKRDVLVSVDLFNKRIIYAAYIDNEFLNHNGIITISDVTSLFFCITKNLDGDIIKEGYQTDYNKTFENTSFINFSKNKELANKYINLKKIEYLEKQLAKLKNEAIQEKSL